MLISSIRIKNADTSGNTIAGTFDNADVSGQQPSIKQEDQGLFVHGDHEITGNTGDCTHGQIDDLQPDKSPTSTEIIEEENNRTIGLLSESFGNMSLGKGHGRLELTFKGSYGRYYGLYTYGHKDGPRYSIHSIKANDFTNSTCRFESQSRLVNGDAEERPMFQIRGVAWKDAKGCGRMDSISEDNWNSVKGQMFVKVKWEDENGSETWERMGAFKTFGWGRTAAKVNTEEAYVYKNSIILRKGAKRHPGDLRMIRSAVKWEIWADKVAANGGRGKSPSPGAADNAEDSSKARL